MAAAVAAEYDEVSRDAQRAAAGEEGLARTLARLRRELRRISSRDYFPGSARDRARAAVEALARQLEVAS
jgi:hypothetical protein